MLRISIAAFIIGFSTLASASDSSTYKKRKLSLEEINFVSSYYRQDGNNSAVTGGIGTEKLTDFATTIDVKLSKYDPRGRKRTITGEVGIDVYTSASSDKIDPSTISSASSSDKRFYPSLTYAITNEQKGSTVSMNTSISSEYDYFSTGFSLGWSKLSRDKNRELSAKGQVFLDTWTVILPVELRGTSKYNKTEPRNSYSASVTLSQVISQRLQLLLLADVALQKGELATLYHRTYFSDGSHAVENLPDSRLKVPLGIRLNYFPNDVLIVRLFYRYYRDTWDLKGHTLELETPLKITPFISVSPFYRYYRQDGVKYFSGFGEHQSSEQFYTSDYDLSTLHSNMFGLGLRFAPPGGIAGITRLNAMEMRYGHYNRSTGLTSDILTVLFKIK
jgi:hypothetical protein